MTRPHHRIITAAALALSLDLLSKAWAERTLNLYQPVPLVDQYVRLTLHYNSGVAFGLGNTGTVWPTIVTGGIITGLIGWLVTALRRGVVPGAASWPVGLILGGALGNFADRLPDGRVTDFLDVGVGATRWPTFNLADVFITIGVVLVMLLTFAQQGLIEAHCEA